VKQPVKLGLYGCGNRTRMLLDALYGEDAYEVVSAFDIREESTKSLCEKYGGKICRSAGEMLNVKGVEAVLISLDPFAHPEAFYRTVEAGKPIFIEKPIAMTAAEAHRMMTTAQEKKIPVHVGFLRRYEARHVAARKFLAEHDTGRLFSVVCNWHHAGETEMINCLNNAPDNFRLKVSQIPFHCCHVLDVMRLYGGDVKAVNARGIKVVKRKYPSPDEVIATLQFVGGAIGYFHYSSMAYCSRLDYLIHTENYTIDCKNGPKIWQRPPTRQQRGEFLKDCRAAYNPNQGPNRYEFGCGGISNVDAVIMSDFLNMVRDGTPSNIPIEDAYKVAELAEAIERSWQEQREITLPLSF